MIAGIALGLVAAVALALRRRQERSVVEDWAARHGWTLEAGATEMARRLAASALMQIGHSRRFSAIAADPHGVRLFEYGCETGFEHDREQHRWIGVFVPVDHGRTRAVISNEEWVIAAAMQPGYERIAPADSSKVDTTNSQRIALVEDGEAWRKSLNEELGRRLAAEPMQRSWQVLTGSLVGFEPAPIGDAGVTELASAGKEIARLL